MRFHFTHYLPAGRCLVTPRISSHLSKNISSLINIVETIGELVTPGTHSVPCLMSLGLSSVRRDLHGSEGCLGLRLPLKLHRKYANIVRMRGSGADKEARQRWRDCQRTLRRNVYQRSCLRLR